MSQRKFFLPRHAENIYLRFQFWIPVQVQSIVKYFPNDLQYRYLFPRTVTSPTCPVFCACLGYCASHVFCCFARGELRFSVGMQRHWKRKHITTTLQYRSRGWLSQYTIWLRTGRPGDRGFDPWQRQGILPLASVFRQALGSTQPPVQWVPGVKSGRGVTLTTHPHLVPRSWMKIYTSSPPCASIGALWDCFTFPFCNTNDKMWVGHVK
jgi:hypothetical protein